MTEDLQKSSLSQSFFRFFSTFFSLTLAADWHGNWHERSSEFRKSLYIKDLRGARGRRPASRWLSDTYECQAFFSGYLLQNGI